MAQDRILTDTTENVIGNMKVKSSMFYKKKIVFLWYTFPYEVKKKSHKILKRIATCWPQIVLQWKNLGGTTEWSRVGAFYNTHEMTEGNTPPAFGTM